MSNETFAIGEKQEYSALDRILYRVRLFSKADTDSAVAKVLGAPRSSLATWISRGTIPYENLAAFANENGISLNWLLFGKGPSTLLEASAEIQALGRTAERLFDGPDADPYAIRTMVAGRAYAISPGDYRWIPFFDVKIAAGGGRVVNMEEPPTKFSAYRKEWLESQGLLEAELFEAVIISDSMYPKIHPNWVVLVNASDTKIISGEVYIVRIGDEMICKYLRHLPDGMIELSSENGDVHKPFTVREGELGEGVVIVGRVIPQKRY